jgi:ABC-type nitrate/sulfonate/bicarbonate transport system substrate-binding protein
VETPVAAPEETEEPATEDTGASDDADEDTEEEEEDTTGAAAGEPEVTDVSIRFSWVPQYQFAGYIVAEVNGYYDEAGLDVTLNGGGPEFPEVQMVAGGSDDFGTSWPDTIMLAHENDIDLVTLATFYQTSPGAYMVHADSGIESVEDFAGKTIGVFYGGGLETEYRGLLAAAGIDQSEMEEVPGEFNLEPFISRRVDIWPVYITSEPHIARREGVEIDLILPRDYGVAMMGDSLFTTEEFATNNPNTTRAFVEATLRGWNWAAENPEEVITLLQEYNPELDTEQLTYEATEGYKLLTYGAGAECIGWNDAEAWQAEQELLVELGVIEETIPLDEIMNNSFVADYYESQGITCTDTATTSN